MDEEFDPEWIGPEQSLFYPQRVELDLERDIGDDDSFEVDNGKTYDSVMHTITYTYIYVSVMIFAY